MAGKKSKRQYTDDAGNDYKVTLDSSNSRGLITGAATALLVPSEPGDGNLPSGLKLRYVQAYLESNPLIRRRFYVGNPDQVTNIYAPGASIEADVFPLDDGVENEVETWIISSYRGERRRLG